LRQLVNRILDGRSVDNELFAFRLAELRRYEEGLQH
jgi:hypothetical protein